MCHAAAPRILFNGQDHTRGSSAIHYAADLRRIIPTPVSNGLLHPRHKQITSGFHERASLSRVRMNTVHADKMAIIVAFSLPTTWHLSVSSATVHNAVHIPVAIKPTSGILTLPASLDQYAGMATRFEDQAGIFQVPGTSRCINEECER